MQMRTSEIDLNVVHVDESSKVASQSRRSLQMGPVALEFPRPQLAGDPTNDLGGGPYLAIGHARVLLVAKPYIHE